jgi:hypothetical protein
MAYGFHYLAYATLSDFSFPCLKDLASSFCGFIRQTARRITFGRVCQGRNRYEAYIDKDLLVRLPTFSFSHYDDEFRSSALLVVHQKFFFSVG